MGKRGWRLRVHEPSPGRPGARGSLAPGPSGPPLPQNHPLWQDGAPPLSPGARDIPVLVPAGPLPPATTAAGAAG